MIEAGFLTYGFSPYPAFPRRLRAAVAYRTGSPSTVAGAASGLATGRTEFPFTRGFPRHLDHLPSFRKFNGLSIRAALRNLHDDHEPFPILEQKWGIL